MQYTVHELPAESLLEEVTLTALSALALGPTSRICDVIPLIAKVWGLPDEILAEKVDRMERAKRPADEGKDMLPGEKLPKYYDGLTIVELLWGILKTAARLDAREERQQIYDTARLLEEALSLPDFLLKTGVNTAKVFWRNFRDIVKKDDPAVRMALYEKTRDYVELLYRYGIDKTA